MQMGHKTLLVAFCNLYCCGTGASAAPAPIIKRSSGSLSRSEILNQLLTPTKSGGAAAATAVVGGEDDGPEAESPARNLAAMLRSTLRKPGPASASLREAFSNSAPPFAQRCHDCLFIQDLQQRQGVPMW